jgi:uncharacterized cupin superfamily protein
MRKTNSEDIDWKEYEERDGKLRRKELSNAVGASALGCSLYELLPDGRSWPYHYHTANEEAVYVLEGEGTLRHDEGEEPLGEGDFVTLPADESGGHQVVNETDEPLRYLAFSTMEEPDVTVYPEMDKIGVFVGSPPGGRDERPLHGYYRTDDETGYWEENDG